MNKDTVIALAREAGDEEWRILIKQVAKHFPDELERFAALVAAHEREAIAQSLDKQADLAGDPMDREWAQEMAAAVRGRGQI